MIGHNVTVYEAQEEVGGQFRSAAYPIGKGELTTLISVFKKNLEDLHVKVHLNTLVTKEMIEQENPDATPVCFRLHGSPFRPLQSPVQAAYPSPL